MKLGTLPLRISGEVSRNRQPGEEHQRGQGWKSIIGSQIPLLLRTVSGPPPGPTSPAVLKSCGKQPASDCSPSCISSSPATQGCLSFLPKEDFALQRNLLSLAGGRKRQNTPRRKALVCFSSFTHHDLHSTLSSPPGVSKPQPSCSAKAQYPAASSHLTC